MDALENSLEKYTYFGRIFAEQGIRVQSPAAFFHYNLASLDEVASCAKLLKENPHVQDFVLQDPRMRDFVPSANWLAEFMPKFEQLVREPSDNGHDLVVRLLRDYEKKFEQVQTVIDVRAHATAWDNVYAAVSHDNWYLHLLRQRVDQAHNLMVSLPAMYTGRLSLDITAILIRGRVPERWQPKVYLHELGNNEFKFETRW